MVALVELAEHNKSNYFGVESWKGRGQECKKCEKMFIKIYKEKKCFGPSNEPKPQGRFIYYDE